MSDRDLPLVEPRPVYRDGAGEPLLDVRDLRTTFQTDAGVVKAADGIDFAVFRNEVFGIVGESGSGKSVTAMTIMGLIEAPPGRVESGRILWKGRDLLTMPESELRTIRGNELSIIFQDPMTSLNPVYTIGQQIREAVRIHNDVSKAEARARAVDMLQLVGIPRPEARVDDYPHQFSGGMRQRAMIAMAIANDPDLLIADEPTTALDVTIQAQILEVLARVQERTKSAIILITHDLGVVASIADRVLVMYAGRQAEMGTVDQIFYRSHHPYTLGLLASLPRVDEDTKDVRLHRIKGDPPSLISVPTGCPFHPRCEFARLPDPCSTEVPPLRPVDADGHLAACHFAEEVANVKPADLQSKAGR